MERGTTFLLESEISWPSCIPEIDSVQSDMKEECKNVQTNTTQVSDGHDLNQRDI